MKRLQASELSSLSCHLLTWLIRLTWGGKTEVSEILEETCVKRPGIGTDRR